MQTIFKITEKGFERQKMCEQTFFVIDAKEFLQALFENLMEEDVKTLDSHLANLIKSAAALFKQEYEIASNEQNDLVNVFSSIKPANIEDRPSLLEAHKQSKYLQSITNSPFLTKEEQRIVCLAFFNDGNAKSKIDEISIAKELKTLEKSSLLFKKNVKQFMLRNAANNKEINTELNKPFPKEELPVFDALLEDLLHSLSVRSATQNAYKLCQNLIPIQTTKRNRLVSFFTPKTTKSSTMDNK